MSTGGNGMQGHESASTSLMHDLFVLRLISVANRKPDGQARRAEAKMYRQIIYLYSTGAPKRAEASGVSRRP
jgi:hypothetical protein